MSAAAAPPATGADAAAAALKAGGVTRVFALCGDQVNSLFHALAAAGIEIIGARHESAAVQMADGWARATGTPGVAVVTGGPGHTNAVTGAAVAQGAQSPVLILSGQAAKARRDRGGNQSLHQADIMQPVVKWAIEAEDGGGVAELVARALVATCTGTPGAVSLSIPVNIADAPLPANALPSYPTHDDGTLAASDAAIAEAARILRAAQRPVLVLGGNAFQHAPHAELAAVVRKLGIPTYTNGQARGVVADDGDVCFGFASPLFNASFKDAAAADAWLVVGTAVDYNIASVVSPAAHVVQVHRDARQLGVGRLPAVAIAGDSVSTLAALARAIASPPPAWAVWRNECGARYREQQTYWARLEAMPPRSEPGIHPAAVCAALKRHWTPRVTLVVDVGDFVNWPKACFPALSPARYMDGGALGNLGGALPVGLGAQIARPGEPVWVFSGDGGFGYHGWELALAVERGLPIKVIVGNDSAWGTEMRLQRNRYARDIACTLPPLRYDRYAALQGAHGLHAETPDELPAAIDALMACSGPCLLDIRLAQLAGRPYGKNT